MGDSYLLKLRAAESGDWTPKISEAQTIKLELEIMSLNGRSWSLLDRHLAKQ